MFSNFESTSNSPLAIKFSSKVICTRNKFANIQHISVPKHMEFLSPFKLPFENSAAPMLQSSQDSWTALYEHLAMRRKEIDIRVMLTQVLSTMCLFRPPLEESNFHSEEQVSQRKHESKTPRIDPFSALWRISQTHR